MAAVCHGLVVFSDETLAWVNGTVVAATNTTGHIIVRKSSSIDIASAVCFINGTAGPVGGSAAPDIGAWDMSELLIATQQLPIKAGSDVFIEFFMDFSQLPFPLHIVHHAHTRRRQY